MERQKQQIKNRATGVKRKAEVEAKATLVEVTDRAHKVCKEAKKLAGELYKDAKKRATDKQAKQEVDRVHREALKQADKVRDALLAEAMMAFHDDYDKATMDYEKTISDYDIDTSGDLSKNLEQRGFPKDWLDRSIGELEQKWGFIFAQILLKVNIESLPYLLKTEGLKNQIVSIEAEIQRFQRELDTLGNGGQSEIDVDYRHTLEQLKFRQPLKRKLNDQYLTGTPKYEVWKHNYEELTDVRKMLLNKGVKLDL